MSVKTIYSVGIIKQKAKELVSKGLISRQQPIYTLCNFIPAGEWHTIEIELEFNGYLLRNHIIDLIQPETWED